MKNYVNEKQESGMRVLVVEPLKRPYIKTISDDLESLQREVGGDIEGVFPFDAPVAIVLNGEGKFNGSALNRGLYDEKGELYDIIAGTFLVTGLTEEDFGSISEELAEKYMEKYKIPERFLLVNGEIVSVLISDGTEKKQVVSTQQQAERLAGHSKNHNGESRKRNKANEGRW